MHSSLHSNIHVCNSILKLTLFNQISANINIEEKINFKKSERKTTSSHFLFRDIRMLIEEDEKDVVFIAFMLIIYQS